MVEFASLNAKLCSFHSPCFIYSENGALQIIIGIACQRQLED